jgi:alginate O-acetyltransferase complex protein AlgI
LWHGAAWTFVIWGALHGLYLAVSVATRRWRERARTQLGLDRFGRALDMVRVAVTFNAVAFAWIFFRANTLDDAALMVGRIAGGVVRGAAHAGAAARSLVLAIYPFTGRQLALAAAVVVLLLAADVAQGRQSFSASMVARPVWVRWAAYYAMLLLVVSIGLFGAQSFIYFQF